MKPLRLIVTGMAIFIACAMHAQFSISVNIGPRPSWAPAVEANVRYYYLPDVDVYYDIPSSMFIYMDNGAWVRRQELPGRCRNYDLHHCRKMVINDYRGDSPYTHCGYSERYAPGRNYDHNDYARVNRGYYSDNDRRNYEISYRENQRYRQDGDERDDHDRGRGHAYGRYKSWKD